MPSFNLVDERWIPCLMEQDGGRLERQELGLEQTLVRAPEIREIFDPSPLVTVGLHRLLLAVLHRNFGPASVDAWSALWVAGQWDHARLAAYFERWRGRFDLFHGQHPFYQVKSLRYEYEHPIAHLAHELCSAANPATLFEHTSNNALTPAQAARYLVAHHLFAVEGLISLEKGQDPKLHKSAVAAPLTKGAVALVKGQNLFQTLMLNLHHYSAQDEEPFPSTPDDCPAWEREEETQSESRWPRGHLDLLTWQSRRIKLHPEVCNDGEILVRQAVIMKGYQFPGRFEQRARETMLAFTKKLKAKPDEDPWPAVRFREDRAVWRDSLALFQSVEEKQARPKTLDWLSYLADSGVLSRSQTIPMDLLGLSNYQAKVFFWRHERLPLPLAYLDDKALLDRLRQAIELAEQIASVLGESAWMLARLLLAPRSDGAGARQPDKKDVRRLVDSLAPARLYWSRLEAPFRRFLVALPKDTATGESGEVEYGATVLPEWAAALRRAAVSSFTETTRGLDSSGRSLKAVAEAERKFHGRLAVVLKDVLKHSEEVTHGPTR